MSREIYEKFVESLPLTIDEDIIVTVIQECLERLELLQTDKNVLLDDNISISLNRSTGQIEVKQNEAYGINWTFDVGTGELVNTI